MFILLYLHKNATGLRININMKAERKRVTADQILDLYAEAKKTKGTKKEEIMKKVILLSHYLNEYIPLDKVRG